MSARTVLGAALIVFAAACKQVPTPAAPASTAVLHGERIFAGGVPPAALNFPYPATAGAADPKSGGQLFTAMNCDGCHGGGAVGWVGPSLIDGRWRYGGSDAEIFTSIYFGQPKGMPAFGGMLPPASIRDIIAYLRSLPPPADVPTQTF
jgi:cytochrome c oxidase cbb3-type subunit 3